MSTRCVFMSSRPSSNTANRPTGPAPMMRASVLIGSVLKRSIFIDLFPAKSRGGVAAAAREGKSPARDNLCSNCHSAPVRERRLSFRSGLLVEHDLSRTVSIAITSATGRSGFTLAALIGGRAHDEPVELVGDLDLAREPRVRPGLEGEVEHVFLHR